MRVLFADKIASHVLQNLTERGFEVHSNPKLKGEDLEIAIREFQPETLVVRSTKVTNNHLNSGDKLALVIRAGAGVNTIDLDSASRLGIFVANCPGKMSRVSGVVPAGLCRSRNCPGRPPPGSGDVPIASPWPKFRFPGFR